jgi:hypothetical protein
MKRFLVMLASLLTLGGCAEMAAIDASVKARDAAEASLRGRFAEVSAQMVEFSQREHSGREELLRAHNAIMDGLDACEALSGEVTENQFYGTERLYGAGELSQILANAKAAAKARYDVFREKQKRQLALQEERLNKQVSSIRSE